MTTKLAKRVQLMLPVRVAVWVQGQRPAFHMACTCDISAQGARLTGVRGVKSVGEVLVIERGKSRAFYRVMWIGKPGTPQHDQVGVQCIEPDKSIWDVNLSETEEVYEPLLDGLGNQLKGAEEVVEHAPGSAQVHIFSDTSGQSIAQGELTRVSYKSCHVKTEGSAAVRSSVYILITADSFDIRLRGFVQPTDVPGVLSLGLQEIRRGDRRAFSALMRKTGGRK
jgi:hypothetical protein